MKHLDDLLNPRRFEDETQEEYNYRRKQAKEYVKLAKWGKIIHWSSNLVSKAERSYRKEVK
jgi:hypothetical protein